MMSESNNSRRDFLKTTSAVAAATGVLSAVKPVHAAAEGTIQVALVGCGGRGTGAAANALSVPNENIKLINYIKGIESFVGILSSEFK